jgi:uncharacterized protein
MRLTAILLAAIAGLYLSVMIFIFVSQERLFIIASDKPEMNLHDYGLTTENIRIETSDGEILQGIYFPNSRAELVVIYAYDNRGRIGAGISMAEILISNGAAVFLYYHRGNGESSGKFSEEGFYRDIEAVIQTLSRVKGYDENDMVLYGRSVGSAVAVYAASKFQVRGLVLDSAFLNYHAMFRDIYPFVPTWLAKYEFPADRFLGEVRDLPVMILHSPDDEFARFHHGKGLYDILDQPKILIELNGGHIENFTVSRDIIEQSWAFYIARLCSRCRPYMN